MEHLNGDTSLAKLMIFFNPPPSNVKADVADDDIQDSREQPVGTIHESTDLQSKLANMPNLNVEVKPKEHVAQPNINNFQETLGQTEASDVSDSTTKTFTISKQQIDMFRTISKAVVKNKMTASEASKMSGLDEEIVIAWVESLEDILATSKETLEKARKYDKIKKHVGGLTKKLTYLQNIVDL